MDAYIYFAINVRLLRWVYCSLRQIVAVNLLFYVRACPHSGDYSGTSLGVRSVALLHSRATLALLSDMVQIKNLSMQKSIQIPLIINGGEIIAADEFIG